MAQTERPDNKRHVGNNEENEVISIALVNKIPKDMLTKSETVSCDFDFPEMSPILLRLACFMLMLAFDAVDSKLKMLLNTLADEASTKKY